MLSSHRHDSEKNMIDVPEWLIGLGGAISGGLITIGLGVFRAKSSDRVVLTTQLINRLNAVEDAAIKERELCEQRLNANNAENDKRLKSRDAIITELRRRIEHLERISP